METTHEVITRLKFIGMIKKEEKVDVKNLKVHQKSMLTSFLRMFNQESRETTLDFLTSTINRAFEIIQLCLSSTKQSDRTMCKNVIEDLIKCTIGLINLQSTYDDDRLFICHIQTLIQGIEVKLKDLRETNYDLFPAEKTDEETEEEIKFN